MSYLSPEKLKIERSKFKENDLTFINYGHCNLLLVSIQGSNFERALVLVENGIDLNFKSNHGFTALHFLAENYNKEIVLEILKREVCIDETNRFLNSPLMSAISNSQYEYARILIQHGADLDLENHTGLTPRKLITLHTVRFPDNEELNALKEII